MATTTTLRDDPDRLYELLPAMYRIADAAKGYPLRALLRLVTPQADMLRDDVQQLWDNFFVETAERWAIPYIGELVSNNLLHEVDLAAAARTAEEIFPDLAGPHLRPPFAIRTRADVARTIYYRRRKGTPPMLEELARDVTGWAAHVVEFFERLTWTQHLDHLRLHSSGTPALRRPDVGDRVQGAFDVASHTVDVRRIRPHEGWHNIPNVGFFVWRLGHYPVRRVVARPIGGTPWRFTFSPLGASAPLFTATRREADETGLAGELNVPAPIRPSAFFEDLEAAARQPVFPERTDYYGDPAGAETSFAVFEDAGAGVQLVPAGDVTCATLRDWAAPGFTRPADRRVHVDVARGRLAIGQQRPAATVFVSYSYGFSADMGGGPYERSRWLVRAAATTQRFSTGRGGTHPSLDAALAAWAANPGVNTVVTILDDGSHAWSNPITLDPTAWLVIEAASGARPHVRPAGGAIRVTGAAPGSALTLSGVLVEGGVEITQEIRRLRVLHSTLVPGRSIAEEAAAAPSGASVVVDEGTSAAPRNSALRVEIAFSITGPLRMPVHAEGLWILDSIVDGTSRAGAPPTIVAAISDAAGASGPPATIERSTLLGDSFFRKLHLGSEAIFTGPVQVEQQQVGCVRFSFVPAGSVTPRRYRCQPSLEIDTQTDRRRREAVTAGVSLPAGWEASLAAAIEAWLVPSFTARPYGRPGYAQLDLAAPRQIRTGAEDGSEMGAFNHLKQPQRETNLRIRLEEYLPVGLEAGILYVT